MSSLDARRALRWTGAAAAVAGPVAAGVTYAAARVLTAAPPPRTRRPTLQLRFEDEHRVLVTGDRAEDPGTWGVALRSGFIQVHDVVAEVEGAARRGYTLLEGTVPTPRTQEERRTGPRRSAGDATPPPTPDEGRRERRRGRRDRRVEEVGPPWPVAGTLTPYAWPDDPQVLARRTGSRFTIDGVRAGGHVLPTWILTPPDANDTWVIGVHGRSSSRTELFRIAHTALRNRHPVLIASYRTDAWTAAPAATTSLGTVEWRDVEAALTAALAGGAARVVLAGCSLGGGLVAQVVRRSSLAPWVAGVVLDSPALSWSWVLRHVANARRLPTVLVSPVMLAARVRARVDWSALDHLSAVDEFAQPVLLLHGDEDDVVPVWISDAFAAARPDLVTFERFPGADHVTSWNVARRRYEAALTRFLERVHTTAGGS